MFKIEIMNKIILNRGDGKTTELIHLADNYNGYIVCKSIDGANDIQNYANSIGCKINLPITYDEFINKR